MKKLLRVILIAFVVTSIFTISFTLQMSSRFREFNGEEEEEEEEEEESEKEEDTNTANEFIEGKVVLTSYVDVNGSRLFFL